MKSNTELLEPDSFYHIYNRGINKQTIFKEEKNYPYFLQKFALQIEPIADTYAYCLLNNHFHFLIKTKTTNDLLAFYKIKHLNKEQIPDFSKIISIQFSALFNGYAQALNKSINRTGGVFEEPFRRILVDNDLYFSELIYYIHRNPQNHGIINDFRDYPYSSYNSILSEKSTKLKREEVLKWFGNKIEFEKFHISQQELKNLSKFEIE